MEFPTMGYVRYAKAPTCSLIRAFASRLSAKLLTDYHMVFLSLNGGYIRLSECTFVKMSHCWKSHVTDQYRKGYLVCQGNSIHHCDLYSQ